MCVDVNTVCCEGGCGKRLVVKTDPPAARRRSVESEEAGKAEDWDHEGEQGHQEAEHEEQLTDDDDDDFEESFERALVEKYKDLIVDGHAERCLWRQAGCKSDIYRLPVVRTVVWQTELRERYSSLFDMVDSIARVQIRPTDAVPSPEKLLATFPKTLLSLQEDDERTAAAEHSSEVPKESETDKAEASPKALQIALCGWRGVTESHTALLSCEACFQRLGLWMYQPDYKRARRSHATSVESTPDEVDAEGLEDDEPSSLDLVEMHREHCPWRNGLTQSATGDFAGWPAWRILWKVVGRYADEHKRRSRDRTLPSTQASPRDTPAPTPQDAADEETVPDDGVEPVDDQVLETPKAVREEIQRQDKERITKLRKLKRVFGLKKKPPTVA